MKKLLIVTLIFTNFLFANYNYTGENSGKIDMHGGKGENLINKGNSLSNKGLNDIGIIKPTPPKAPENLIKDEQKNKKEDKK
ncbi:hypothetical protein AFAEC_1155 [Aliarcobacter faecis]|uniref:hypothetical protein n=1 Tax=Aliarcobacter faecis TaxID=1564138 RepID=UPI00047E7227|nr:hypothetical protein [Aliarcobacter faecis]QKF73320.1 hypothetical protein AFAEC_1155 [Aliarcobacter faecis]